ncbi:MAG: sensor histidine kinase [Chloroherpetonaceae bacterium]
MHQSYTVLIIDDNSDDITLLERFLGRNLIPIRSIMVARKGQEGLDKIRDELPDFIIVGDNCPDMGISELFKQLTEIASPETLPMLFLINDEATSLIQSLRAKQVGVMKKSMLTPEKLRDVMQVLIEKAETKLERNRARAFFALLAEHSNDAVSLTDANGVLIDANQNYFNLFQLDATSIGKPVQMHDYSEIFFKSAHASTSKMFHDDVEGNRFELEVKRLFIEERGKRSFMLSIHKITKRTTLIQVPDIGSIKERSENDEIQLLRQLESIQTSAFQTVLTILRAKSKRLSKGQHDHLLEEHTRRLKLIAAASKCARVIESQLKVSTAEYVENIFAIFQASALIQNNVVVKYEGETLWIDFHSANLIGLILGELITNALKHAFTTRGGVLSVSFYREGENLIGMTVSDSGVGMPFKVDAKPPDSMGLMIVSSLTKKLNGKIEVKRHMGTTVRIIFAHNVQQPLSQANTETVKLS